MTENQHATGHAEDARRVVVGVDGSDNSAQAARWAAREALDLGLPLTVLHAVHLPDTNAAPYEPEDFVQRAMQEGRALLESSAQALRAAFPALTVETVLAQKSAAHALGDIAPETALMVTGTRGHGGFAGMLVGSVSRKLAAHAACPLVVVRGEETEPEVSEVVVGVELGQAQTVIRYAFAAARRHGALLRAVHAWWPAVYASPTGAYVADVEDTHEAEVKAVEALLAPVRAEFADVKVEIAMRRGNPVPTLIEAADRSRLLIVGSHRHHGPFSVGAGYVVDGLLAHSPTPVAVVPIH